MYHPLAMVTIHGVFAVLIDQNLLLHCEPVIHFLFNAMFDTAFIPMSRFVSSAIVKQYRRNILSAEEIMDAVENSNNSSPCNNIFVGILIKENQMWHKKMVIYPVSSIKGVFCMFIRISLVGMTQVCIIFNLFNHKSFFSFFF